MSHLLVATLGTSWQIIPELLGYTNPHDLALYGEKFESGLSEREAGKGISPFDGVWLVSTHADRCRSAWDRLVEWHSLAGLSLELRLWRAADVEDIDSRESSSRMADLIYRVVALAHEQARDVSLCLAGGRKTMSAELQQAGLVFGCRSLLHVIENLSDEQRRMVAGLPLEAWCRPLPNDLIGAFEAIVIDQDIPRNEALAVDTRWKSVLQLPGASSGGNKGRVPEDFEVPTETRLYDQVHTTLRESERIAVNFRLELTGGDKTASFRLLHVLPVQVIEELQSSRVGLDPARETEDLRWLQSLPKADLHCHLGGVLSAQEMIVVAEAVADQVDQARREDAAFDRDIRSLCEAAGSGDRKRLDEWLGERPAISRFRDIHRRWEVRRPMAAAAVLLAFRDQPALLDEWIFGELREEAKFRAIGFKEYEALGDLQGSALLQSRETIRATLRVLAQKCQEDNIRYIELRCSPVKYTVGGLREAEVVETIVDGQSEFSCPVRLIFIGSRHRDTESIERHIELAKRILRDARLQSAFAGFDLAGDESAMEPAAIRDKLRELHEYVVRVTIHAGESERSESVKNIWQAIYDLSADRIGHGLSLATDARLAERIRERRVAIELCPSSNDQVVGFHDSWLDQDTDNLRRYPLGALLQRGVRATINTDNPGISRTTLSREYLKAARMTEGGLTKWQVLQLIRNSFRAAFCDEDLRRKLLTSAEEQIVAKLFV